MKFRSRTRSWYVLLPILWISLLVNLPYVRGLQSSQIISSYGKIVEVVKLVEYGLCASYATYQERVVWRDLFIDSGAKWSRFNIWGVGENTDFNHYIDTIHSMELKTLGIFMYPIMPSEMWDTFTLQDWKTYVRYAIETFKGQLDAVEVWNEPDSQLSTRGYMDNSPEHYFDILRVVYEEIKAVDPNVKVIAGSFMTLLKSDEISWEPIGGEDLLRAIWELGAADYCDAISIHTYQFWLDIAGITAGQAVEKAWNITEKPIWVTELGAKSSGFWMGEEWTEQKQADWMREKITELNDATPKPETIIWYHFYHGLTSYCLVYSNYTTKLAYDVFKSFTIN